MTRYVGILWRNGGREIWLETIEAPSFSHAENVLELNEPDAGLLVLTAPEGIDLGTHLITVSLSRFMEPVRSVAP